MPKKPSTINQTAIGDGNVQVAGENNTVNIIQKIFNIFKSDAETTEQRNRRIMLGHVENFWVKGILEKSLHGAALLELGIKEDPDALNYPWAIKRESNKETLPAGTSMLEIFQEIGMGRSLLILGAPGSGKTTMLLELTRQLIERASEDVTEPIPVVFNLSSWTEKLTLADWLARELNVIYTIPKKMAPTWVKENKMLFLLDGLDEVRQESRDKCVDAIHQFRKENGLTSIAVCSRIQDYAELKTRLSFDGAIEIQPLTSKQVDSYFKSFGKGMVGIRQVLGKDTVLRELVETPLFLSILTLTHRDQTLDMVATERLDIESRRKQLFDTYVQQVFKRSRHSQEMQFSQQDVIRSLTWLAQKMIGSNQSTFMMDRLQPSWLENKKPILYYRIAVAISSWLFGGVVFGLLSGQLGALLVGLVGILSIEPDGDVINRIMGFEIFGLIFGVIVGLIVGLIVGIISALRGVHDISTVDVITWSWEGAKGGLKWAKPAGIYGLVGGLPLGLAPLLYGGFFGLLYGFLLVGMFASNYGLFGEIIVGLLSGLVFGLICSLISRLLNMLRKKPNTINIWQWLSWGTFAGLMTGIIIELITRVQGKENGAMIAGIVGGVTVALFLALLGVTIAILASGAFFGFIGGMIGAVFGGFKTGQISVITKPGERISYSIKNAFLVFLYLWPISGVVGWVIVGLLRYIREDYPAWIDYNSLIGGAIIALIFGFIGGLHYGGSTVIQHYVLRFILAQHKFLPWHLVPFLDHCVDLIFLRRVGGGYIFVHRLLMEHFADMNPADEK